MQATTPTTSTTATTSTKTSARKRHLRRGAAAAVALAAFAGIPSAAHAGFPGTNGKIVFVSERDGNREIYVMNANGTVQTNLTDHVGSDDNPAWSPDGKQIAFSSVRPGTQDSDIFVMNADGTGVKQLTNAPGIDSYPSWSPKGQIIFASLRAATANPFLMDFDLYTMNPDGSNEQPVSINDGLGLARETDPAFSNDGKYASYTRTDTAGQTEVVVMKTAPFTAGWNATQGPVDMNANWSPKAAPAGGYPQIAFESDRSGDWEIYSSESGGTVFPDPNLTNRPLSNETEPAWAPSGTKLAFTSDRNGQPDIYVMNADGSGQARLTTSSAADYSPDWQPIPAAAPPCTITGTAGDDTLHGTWWNDVICGLGGNDTIYGMDGNDRLLGGAGDDKLYGHWGLDYLSGQAGNDQLFGQDDNDELLGGDGNDQLDGGNHVDTLNSGAGSDTCKQESADPAAAC